MSCKRLKISKFISFLNNQDTNLCVDCERAFQMIVDGNCKTPIACEVRILDEDIYFRGLVSMPDGSVVFKVVRGGLIKDAKKNWT